MKSKYSCIENLLFFPPVKYNKEKLKTQLKGKNILITGATFGIGAAITYKLAETGANLILVARTKEKLLAIKKVVERKGGSAKIFSTDLYNQEQVDILISEILKIEDGIDVFISNAGKSIKRSIYKSLDRFHDFSRTMSINYYTPVKIMLSIIPMLKKNNGHIINISTLNALIAPVPEWAAYQASKSALDIWLKSAEPELKADKIKITSIYLPLVKTRMILPTKQYRKMPAMTTNHVANIVCKSLITGRKKFKPWWGIWGQIFSYVFKKQIAKQILKNE